MGRGQTRFVKPSSLTDRRAKEITMAKEINSSTPKRKSQYSKRSTENTQKYGLPHKAHQCLLQPPLFSGSQLCQIDRMVNRLGNNPPFPPPAGSKHTLRLSKSAIKKTYPHYCFVICLPWCSNSIKQYSRSGPSRAPTYPSSESFRWASA